MEHLELTLLVSSFVIPFILAITLLGSSVKNLPKRVMGFAMLNAFFVFLANYFYFQKLYEVYSWIHSIHIATVIWIFPLVYLYVKTIIGNGRGFRKEFVHLIPGAVFGITSAILFYGFLNFEERIYYLSNYRGNNEFLNRNLKALSLFRFVDVLLIVGQIVYYSIVFFRIPKTYHKKLNNEYSNLENLTIDWLKWFNIGFVIVGLLSILFYVFNPFHEKNELFLVFFLFTISGFIWALGLWSFKQKKPETALHELEVLTPKENGNLSDSDEKLYDDLMRYFKSEKPFLQPDLNLTTVCKKIGTNRSYLSRVVNTNEGMNFNAFVNQYRIEYIEEYLKNNAGSSKEELAFVGGFGSISSFRRAMEKSKMNGNS